MLWPWARQHQVKTIRNIRPIRAGMLKCPFSSMTLHTWRSLLRPACDDGLDPSNGEVKVMQTLIQDLRYSVRQLLKSPGFTLTAVISLALGIGATTAVFSVIYAALIDPYPFPRRTASCGCRCRTKAGSVETVNLNRPQIQQLRQVRAIESMLAMDYHAMTMTGHDLPENVNVIGLISNGFDDLGVPPVLGRGLLRSDAIDGQDPQPVAVLSYKFWQEQFLARTRRWWGRRCNSTGRTTRSWAWRRRGSRGTARMSICR